MSTPPSTVESRSAATTTSTPVPNLGVPVVKSPVYVHPVSLSLWWSVYIWAPIALICLIPFSWYYLVPHLGYVAKCLFIWTMTLAGFVSALALVYLGIITTFNKVGAKVDGTLTSIPANLEKFGDQVHTSQGLAVAVVFFVALIFVVLCLPSLRDKISHAANTLNNVSPARIAPASPSAVDNSWDEASSSSKGRKGSAKWDLVL